MKKAFLFLLMTFLMSLNALKSQSQGGDYVIIMDNSGSITPYYDDMEKSVHRLVDQILGCNEKNRVSVVHYGTGLHNQGNPTYAPRIYIESDFTNDPTTAHNFTRRLNVGDHFHEALGLVGNAIDNISNINIVSPQTTLNRDYSQPLKVVVFTDGGRGAGDLNAGSYLVNYYNPTMNTAAAFSNINDFKVNRKAIFAVVHMSYDTASREAGAAIASVGGSYMGNIEVQPGDPQNNNIPRMYYPRTNFVMSDQDIKEIVIDICDYSWGGGSVQFWHESNMCNLNSVQSVYGNYYLPPGANFGALKLFLRDIATGNEVPVDYNPTFTGTDFYEWLTTAAFPSPPTSGQHKFIMRLYYEVGGVQYIATSLNQYPFFPIDFDMSCSKMAPSSSSKRIQNDQIDRNADPNHVKKDITVTETKQFQLSPNPTQGTFKIVLNKAFENGTVDVTDLSGNKVYTTSFKQQKEIDVDLTNQKEGIYLVKIISNHGEIYTEKLIKK
ncbi:MULTISPECIES: T9SS type A sorting domain-containing protein [Chryseobacterium]|uniref:VWFA domain-containing protein n=1 Tax=Chryseobacterium geocarposphaerae TaxID=1416776 RepID=A0ABU1L9T9_9FLAO|nr:MULTISPECIES: T9SS type A sorting domain-containing protein [Chryseobacterium]MDR6403479.1 hypothetical protein [Chryseobacterium geocarposphaerae]MDR6697033.1 hypothetical protein [Chryseobacterium ginsenosidimutans]